MCRCWLMMKTLEGGVTYNPDGLTSISFDVKSKSPKGHARPAIDITYAIGYLDVTKAGPIVSFPGSAIQRDRFTYFASKSVHYAEVPSGETTITSVPLSIDVNNAEQGVFVRHIISISL